MSIFTGTAQAGRQREKRAASRLHWGVTLALAFCVVLPQARADERPTFPDFEPDTLELVPYQSPEYRFQVIPLDEEPPVGFEQPGFDDTGFETGTAAFGGGRGGAGGGVDCPLQNTVETEWPVNTQLLVRRTVSVPADVEALRVMISVDNDIVGVFFNGTAIADFIAHDDCPIRDEFRLDVPPELVQPGENVVTFHVLDRGVESFFDARILADLTPDQLVAQLNQTVIVQQTPLVPVDDVLVRCQPDLGGASVSYVVAGTGERAEIKTEGTGADTLSTEISLDDELLASGTITSDEIALSRSLDATERLASLDAGTLSVGSVLTDQLVVAGLFHCIASPTGLSCATTCDLKAAHESGIATLGAGLAKGGGVGADIARRGTLSSVGAAFGGDVISAVAEALAKIRIENARQQCLEGCRQTPPVTPPPVAASATLRCKNGQTILITTNTRGGRCERVGDGVGCADGANFAAGRCSGSPLGLAACVEVEGNACCTVCTRGDQCSRCPEEPRPGPVSAR